MAEIIPLVIMVLEGVDDSDTVMKEVFIFRSTFAMDVFGGGVFDRLLDGRGRGDGRGWRDGREWR